LRGLGRLGSRAARMGLGAAKDALAKALEKGGENLAKDAAEQAAKETLEGGGKAACEDAAKKTGSYTNTHQSGKTYSGKGGQSRMNKSAAQKAKEYGDPVVAQEHAPAPNTDQAFIDEQNRIESNGGPGGNTYNKINSPGKKLRGSPPK